MNLHSGEAGMYGAPAPKMPPRSHAPRRSDKPATISTLRERLQSNHTRPGLMDVANAALAQGEATFLYAQHCDLDDALLAVGEAAKYGEIAKAAIIAAQRA